MDRNFELTVSHDSGHLWIDVVKKQNKTEKREYINTTGWWNLLSFDEFALTWQYVGVSVLLPVGPRVPHLGGKVFANSI